jgi:hypothetical protein
MEIQHTTHIPIYTTSASIPRGGGVAAELVVVGCSTHPVAGRVAYTPAWSSHAPVPLRDGRHAPGAGVHVHSVQMVTALIVSTVTRLKATATCRAALIRSRRVCRHVRAGASDIAAS